MAAMVAMLFADVAVFADASVNVSDGVMTINGTGTLSEILSDVQIQAIQNNSIDKIEVVNTHAGNAGGLKLDIALSDYRGAWEIKGRVDIASANAMGVSGEGEPASEIIIYKSPNKGMLYASVTTSIDKPVRTVGTFDAWPVVRAENIELTFSKNVTFGCDGQLYLGGSAAKMYFNSGFDADGFTVDTVGAGGFIYVRNVPCSIKNFQFRYVFLALGVAGNKIEKINFQNLGKGLLIEADGALSAYPSQIVNMGGEGYVNLKGHDVAFGEISGFRTTGTGYFSTPAGSPATMTFSNAGSLDLNIQVKGPLTLKKKGAGTITINRNVESTGALEVEEGRVELGADASWQGCSGVKLSGGALSVAAVKSLPSSLAVTVTDANAYGVLELADGCVFPVAALSVGGQTFPTGFYGGMDSGSLTVLSCFSKDKTGVLSIPNVLTVTVGSGETKTLAEMLSLEESSALAAGRYTQIIKSGAGTLLLDSEMDYAGIWTVNEGRVKATASSMAFGYSDVPAVNAISVASAAKLDLGFDGQKTTVGRRILATRLSEMAVRGEVHCRGGIDIDNGMKLSLAKNCSFYPDGGLSVGGLLENESGLDVGIVVEGEPMTLKSFNPIYTIVDLRIPGNKIETLELRDRTILKINCEEAFSVPYPQFKLKPSLDNTPRVRLFGHTLRVGDMELVGESAKVSDGNKGTSLITSDMPGVLSFIQSVDRTNDKVRVTGNVSLVKGGDAPFTFNIPIESTGTLTVTGGVFAMTANADWLNCTNVTVSGGNAAVEIVKSETFAKKAEFDISEGGKIKIPQPGAVQHASYLFIDGRLQPGGTWGSSQSPAKHKDDVHFSGAGVLSVLGNIGTVVVVR